MWEMEGAWGHICARRGHAGKVWVSPVLEGLWLFWIPRGHQGYTGKVPRTPGPAHYSSVSAADTGQIKNSQGIDRGCPLARPCSRRLTAASLCSVSAVLGCKEARAIGEPKTTTSALSDTTPLLTHCSSAHVSARGAPNSDSPRTYKLHKCPETGASKKQDPCRHEGH